MLYNRISFEPFLQEWLKYTYLCSVFFIVLDLRLTKVGLSGPFFIAPILRRFIVFLLALFILSSFPSRSLSLRYASLEFPS